MTTDTIPIKDLFKAIYISAQAAERQMTEKNMDDVYAVPLGPVRITAVIAFTTDPEKGQQLHVDWAIRPDEDLTLQ